MKILKLLTIYQISFGCLCFYGQSDASSLPADLCGKQLPKEEEEKVIVTSEDGKTWSTTMTICAIARREDGKGYVGVGDVEFIVSKIRPRPDDICDIELASSTEKREYSFDCYSTTSSDGEAKCDISCPVNYEPEKTYRLILCGDYPKRYVHKQGNMSLVKKPRDLAFKIQECKVKESDGILKSHNKWNVLYFFLEEIGGPVEKRSNSAAYGYFN